VIQRVYIIACRPHRDKERTAVGTRFKGFPISTQQMECMELKIGIGRHVLVGLFCKMTMFKITNHLSRELCLSSKAQQCSGGKTFVIVHAFPNILTRRQFTDWYWRRSTDVCCRCWDERTSVLRALPYIFPFDYFHFLAANENDTGCGRCSKAVASTANAALF
jgi:hypothetical protein